MGGASEASPRSWVRQLGGPGADLPFAAAADPQGGLVTVGHFAGEAHWGTFPHGAPASLSAAGPSDVFVTRHTPAGELSWAVRLGGPGVDEARAVAVDGAGQVYVTGYFQNVLELPGAELPGVTRLRATGNGAFLIKLSAAGEVLWGRSWGSERGAAGTALAVDTAGNVHLAGNFRGRIDFDPGPGERVLTSAGRGDVFLIRLSPGGELDRAVRFGGPGNEAAQAVAVDSSGRIYLSGTFEKTVEVPVAGAVAALESRGFSDVFLWQLGAGFEPRWVRALGGGQQEAAAAIAVAGDALYLVGRFQGQVEIDGPRPDRLRAAGVFDVFAARWTWEGELVWARSLGGAATDLAFAATVDAAGHLVLAGLFQGEADLDPGTGVSTFFSPGLNNPDAFVALLDGAGELVAAHHLGGPGAEQVLAVAAAGGALYAVGSFNQTVDKLMDAGLDEVRGKTDIFVARLPAGAPP